LDYQFYGETHSQKRKMIGNALPPLLAYHLAHSMLGTKPCDLPPPSEAISIFSAPETHPKKTLPDKPGSSFSSDRKFRFAIPGLRFKSGVRFELSNAAGKWAVRFFYGDSKNTGQMDLGSHTIREIESLPGAKKFCVKARKVVVESGLLNICPNGLQAAWSRSGEGIHPFELLDSLGSLVDRFLAECDPDKIAKSVVSSLLSSRGNPKGSKKLILNSRSVFAGILVCSSANEILSGDFFSVDS
jgi:DNA (cytosine-5)-methyltransferase 1